MSICYKFQSWCADARGNRWINYFTVFNRVALAAGFLPSGFVKIMGERFTSLSNNHPMGNYLEALHHTGYYYTFIGIAQMTAAILLIIPRTALLGAVLYFPIILNICILSLSVRFEGSLVSSPLMVVSCSYLLLWDIERIKLLFPTKHTLIAVPISKPKIVSNKFPASFFAGVVAVIFTIVFTLTHIYGIMPRNTLSDCKMQCSKSEDPNACLIFCEGIHKKGEPLSKALDNYYETLKIKSDKKKKAL